MIVSRTLRRHQKARLKPTMPAGMNSRMQRLFAFDADRHVVDRRATHLDAVGRQTQFVVADLACSLAERDAQVRLPSSVSVTTAQVCLPSGPTNRLLEPLHGLVFGEADRRGHQPVEQPLAGVDAVGTAVLAAIGLLGPLRASWKRTGRRTSASRRCAAWAAVRSSAAGQLPRAERASWPNSSSRGSSSVQPSQLIRTNVSLSKCCWNQLKSAGFVVGGRQPVVDVVVVAQQGLARTATQDRQEEEDDQDDFETVSRKKGIKLLRETSGFLHRAALPGVRLSSCAKSCLLTSTRNRARMVTARPY